MAGSEYWYYRVELFGGVAAEVPELDVRFIDKLLSKSNLASSKKKMIREKFMQSIREGKFVLLMGDIRAGNGVPREDI